MHFLDQTWPTPAENLAADEVLLDDAESGNRGETLRFWQAPCHFVVLGHSNRVDTEVNAIACATLGIPILRRCSGGGAVLQGPGSLSYALILRIDRHPELGTVSRTNHFIMSKHAAILAELLGRDARIQGTTDLAINGRKISGNAQRRRRHFLLFHGTLLLTPDLELLEKVLPEPSRMPDYRAKRRHLDFLGRISADSAMLKLAWRKAWGAEPSPQTVPDSLVRELVATKYNLAAWNRKF
jgi:lipoate-protein ligase A